MKISIIIPTHNRPSLLARALESIRQQTVKPLEVIVVDDASQESPENLLTSFQGSGIEARYFRFDQPGGPSRARNHGARQARGEILMFLDDDDTWESHKIAVQLQVFQKNPRVGLVYSGRIVVQEGQRDRELYRIEPQAQGCLYPQILFLNLIGPTSSVALYKSLFDQVQGFDERLTVMEDHELWIRCAMVTEIEHDHACHLRYTLAPASTRQLSSQGQRHLEAADIFWGKYGQQLQALGFLAVRKAKARIYFSIAKAYHARGSREFIPWLFKSFLQYPHPTTLLLLIPIDTLRQLRHRLQSPRP